MSSLELLENAKDTDDDYNTTDTILYELLVHSEWQEPEIIIKSQERVEDFIRGRKLVSAQHQGSRWLSFKPWTLSASHSLTESLLRLIENQLEWQFAVGGDGNFIAILQNNILEIRASKDEYSSTIGRNTISKDTYLHWRKMEWSPDCSMLAIGYSNGNIDVFDLIGSKLFSIINNNSSVECDVDIGEAPSSLLFLKCTVKNTQWSYELIVCNFKGHLTSYLVSTNDGYQLNHTFNFTKHSMLSNVTSICYHSSHNLLFVSGCTQCASNKSVSHVASEYGISAWRILTDEPYYRIATSNEKPSSGNTSFLTKIPNWFNFKKKQQEAVFKMCVSPGGKHLAALHTSGSLSIWNLPSLLVHKVWELPDQPKYSSKNSLFLDFQNKKRQDQAAKDPLYPYLIDVNWWSDNSLILARSSGSVTVSSSETLKNQLGESCEWFEPLPKISFAFNNGFLALECDCQVASRRRSLAETNGYDDDSSDDEESLIFKSSHLLKTALYYMTDSEKFQPPRKPPKILTKTYRLLSLRSTTPAELFKRKMDLEEYGEALSLAKAYGLDSDLVYQRQWRKTPVSVVSIQDYLSKINKRSWVLHECLERVSDDIDATQELLMYGIRGSSLQTLIAMGKGEDDGKFTVISPSNDFVDDFGYDYDENDVHEHEKEKALLQEINYGNLTLDQKQLCQVRHKLIVYLDKLKTYEIMLGGSQSAAENFDPKFYQRFRSQSVIDSSIEFARNSNWHYVEIMFSRHREETLPFRLAILSNFPETVSCYEYRHLLPENDEGFANEDSYVWDGEQKRLLDWCEHTSFQEIVAPMFHQSIALYEECSELKKYHHKNPSNSLLTEWYIQRSMEIEERSCLVDNALELIKIGRAKNIQGLEDLHDDLVTLETLVYDCQIDFCLEHYRALSDIQRVNLLMSTATDDIYIKYMRRWLLPYLDQCEKKNQGSKILLLRQYMVTVAKDDLCRCLQIFQHSRIDSANPIVPSVSELMDIALECVYSSTRNDQLGVMKSVLECLPSRGFGPSTPEIMKLHDMVDDFEKHLQAAFILSKNHLPQTIKYIKDCLDNPEEVKALMTKLLRSCGRKSPFLSEDQWKEILSDILSLQKVFLCVSPDLCYEIYVESLLCSNDMENIHRAGNLMECTKSESIAFEKKVGYGRSIKIILSVAKEYFNSSSSLTDSCMDFARACLTLITDDNEDIEAELDLISALSMLHDYNISILPLQVRLCIDRIRLIEKVLGSNLRAYCSPQRLLKLAYLLRVSGKDKFEREGKILTLAAKKALENLDFSACFNLCDQIMTARHDTGWEICHQLGQCGQFNDLKARCQLLSFAVTHCSSDQIEPIIRSRCLIELQILNEKLHSKMDSSLDEDDFVDAISDVSENQSARNSEAEVATSPLIGSLARTHQLTTQVIHSTSKATKEILTSLTSQDFWKHTLSWVRPSHLNSSTITNDTNINNKDFYHQGVHAFYKGLVTPCHVSQYGVDYMHYSCPLVNPALEFSETLLRSAVLAEILTEGEHLSLNPLVLLNLAQETLTADCAVGLAYLLALKDPIRAEDCLNLLPSSSISLHLRCYYFSLQILSACKKDPDIFLDSLYLQAPDAVIQAAMHIAQKLETPELKEVTMPIAPLIESLHHDHNTLSDLIQGQTLHRLGRGVDVVRFSYDSHYKGETILGLAMTLDEDVYNTAKSLAEKHKIPFFELYKTHLEFLFSESDLSTQNIKDRIDKLNLLEELCKQPERLNKCLTTNIYPTIAGNDHARLILYYQLMEQCPSSPANMEPHSLHIKLLQEIKTAAPSLDYKQLMDGASDPLSVINGELTDSNVHLFAKMSSEIVGKNGPLNSSDIYCLWAQKMFLTDVKPPPQSAKSEWIHLYESCSEYLQKLQPRHLIEFVNKTIFSREGCTRLMPETRSEILRRIIKYCEKQHEKCQDKQKKDWKKVIEDLTLAASHLKLMLTDLVLEMKKIKDPVLQAYILELEMSWSSPAEVQFLLEKSVLEGNPLSTLQQLISICPPSVSLSPGEVIINSISHVVEVVKGKVKPRFQSTNTVETLQKIIVQIQKYVEDSDDILVIEDVLNILRPFCADESVSLHTRLNILEILEKAFTLDTNDSGLILLYRTQVFIAAGWPKFEVDPTDVETDSGRQNLFKNLVTTCSSVQQALILSKLLNIWPTSSSAEAMKPHENPWFMLFTVLLQCPEPQCLDAVVSILQEHLITESFLSGQLYKQLLDGVQSKGSTIHTVKLALLSNNADFHKIAIDEILKAKQITEKEFDSQVLNLILQRHLAPKLISCPIFSCLIDHVLNSGDRFDLPLYLRAETVARDLYDAGFIVEAGTLLLQSQSIPELLQNYHAAYVMAEKWFK